MNNEYQNGFNAERQKKDENKNCSCHNAACRHHAGTSKATDEISVKSSVVERADNSDRFVKTDAESLHTLNKSVLMALHSLKTLDESVKDDRDMKSMIAKQQETYEDIKDKVTRALFELDEEVGEANMFSKAMLFSSIKLKTMTDDSDSHIADMLIQGSNMGIIELTKLLNSVEGKISVPCKILVEGSLSAMEKFVEDLKEFL